MLILLPKRAFGVQMAIRPFRTSELTYAEDSVAELSNEVLHGAREKSG